MCALRRTSLKDFKIYINSNSISFSKELLHHLIPFAFQGLIHYKTLEGSSGHAGEMSSIVTYIQIESLHVGRIKSQFFLFDQTGNILWIQAEDKMKTERCFLSLN